MENQENKQPEEQKPEESPKQKSVFTATTSAAQPKVNLKWNSINSPLN